MVSGRGWSRGLGPIPGKKRAVLGRDVATVESHLVQFDLHNDSVILCEVKALCRGWGQLLPSLGLARRKVWVMCFIL